MLHSCFHVRPFGEYVTIYPKWRLVRVASQGCRSLVIHRNMQKDEASMLLLKVALVTGFLQRRRRSPSRSQSYHRKPNIQQQYRTTDLWHSGNIPCSKGTCSPTSRIANKVLTTARPENVPLGLDIERFIESILAKLKLHKGRVPSWSYIKHRIRAII
jgi:hypothetical protein